MLSASVENLSPVTAADIPRFSTPEERFLAEILIRNPHLIFYYEPHIFGKRPDFYVYNLTAQSGKIVEVTRCRRSELPSDLSKQEQIDALNLSGEPFTILCRENIEKMRRRYGYPKSYFQRSKT
ncbi:MAG TPA: hypothetical protein VF828_01500 [Patescibacteria group bacterium]